MQEHIWGQKSASITMDIENVRINNNTSNHEINNIDQLI